MRNSNQTIVKTLRILILLIALAPALHAADVADPSHKIREQLRAVTLQLHMPAAVWAATFLLA